MTSAKPSFVTSATRAPRRSSRALVATVVPWAKTVGRADPAGRTAAAPARTASPGSSGVDGSLATDPSSPTTSVNVPPVSTPMRTADRPSADEQRCDDAGQQAQQQDRGE